MSSRSGHQHDGWRAGRADPEAAATWRAGRTHPVVGITADLVDAAPAGETPARLRAASPMTYVRAVAAAGGVPLLLPPLPELAPEYARRCEAFVFTGGDDPRTEAFGEPTHPNAVPIHPDRQAFELALLSELERRPTAPVLGVCLGMQMMALHAGGKLNQHMPDDTPTAEHHRHDRVHEIVVAPEAGEQTLIVPGPVTSHHRQAVREPGRLRVVARAPDGIIEAVDDPGRAFYVGVQWHPERTAFEPLGVKLFRRLVQAVRG